MQNFRKSIYRIDNDEGTPPPTSSEWHFSSPGRSSSSLACANTSFTNTWYTLFTGGTIPALGATVYLNSTLTTAIAGGNLWYNLQESFIDEPQVYQIDNSGVIIDAVIC